MEKKPEEKLRQLNLVLPEAPKPLAAYVPCARAGNILFVSGMLPLKEGNLAYAGKLGKELTLEQGKEAAKLACLNALSAIKAEIKELKKVSKILKLTCSVASTENFAEQHLVANAASELLIAVFGEKGKHARAAIGVTSLPKNAAVEIEIVVGVL